MGGGGRALPEPRLGRLRTERKSSRGAPPRGGRAGRLGRGPRAAHPDPAHRRSGDRRASTRRRGDRRVPRPCRSARAEAPDPAVIDGRGADPHFSRYIDWLALYAELGAVTIARPPVDDRRSLPVEDNVPFPAEP